MSHDESDDPRRHEPRAADERDRSDGEHDRAEILARRKRFVVAALSTLSLGAAVADCLPTACLSPIRPPEDAQPDGDGADTADAAEPSDARPMRDGGSPLPCLDIAPMDGGADD